MREGKLSVLKTPSGGYHCYYKHEYEHGGGDLAHWDDGDVMIEIRGNGQYVATHPSPGYSKTKGVDIYKLDYITKEDLEHVHNLARSYSKIKSQPITHEKSDRKWPDKWDDLTVDGNLVARSQIFLPVGSSGYSGVSFSDAKTTGFGRYGATTPALYAGGVPMAWGPTGQFALMSDAAHIDLGSSVDAKLYRDAAQTFGFRNSTTQQKVNIYNTAASATSNYERLALTGVAGASLNLTAETNGTGADNLDIILTPAGTGSVKAVGGSLIGAPPSCAFASLPAAASSTGLIYKVTDAGISGSLWMSNGTTWVPTCGQVLMLQTGIPFIVPSSGTVAVTTGALALTTALDQIYTKCYMYFPANTWTSSTAGFYYVVMSTTDDGLVYSDKYVSGQPAIPASPALVTTGAGAYTQTGENLQCQGPTITIPASSMGLNGRLFATGASRNNNSGNAKAIYFHAGASQASISSNTTATGSGSLNLPSIVMQNAGVAAVQYVTVNGSMSALWAENTAADVTVYFMCYLATAGTDYVILHSPQIILYNY